MKVWEGEGSYNSLRMYEIIDIKGTLGIISKPLNMITTSEGIITIIINTLSHLIFSN